MPCGSVLIGYAFSHLPQFGGRCFQLLDVSCRRPLSIPRATAVEQRIISASVRRSLRIIVCPGDNNDASLRTLATLGKPRHKFYIAAKCFMGLTRRLLSLCKSPPRLRLCLSCM